MLNQGSILLIGSFTSNRYQITENTDCLTRVDCLPHFLVDAQSSNVNVARFFTQQETELKNSDVKNDLTRMRQQNARWIFSNVRIVPDKCSSKRTYAGGFQGAGSIQTAPSKFCFRRVGVGRCGSI